MSNADQASRAAYETWHQAVEANPQGPPPPWERMVCRYLSDEDVAGRSVLEIGCGRGQLAARVMATSPAPARYVAADFAESAVRFGRERARDAATTTALHWIVADIQKIPAGQMFDTVISCETIEHLPDPLAALREIHRVLRPGGRLFLTTPNYMGPFGLYRGYLRLRGRRYTEGGQPICRFTSLPRTWWWLRRAGFRVRAIDAIGHYVLSPGRVPFEPQGVAPFERFLWPVGLHSLFVAEKPRP